LKTEKIGFDIGGVIFERDKKNISIFSPRYLELLPVPEVFEALSRIVNERFRDDVYLVSKCGEEVRRRTLNWLSHHDFFRHTGINPNHLEFCLEHWEKAKICERLGLTHFVDDRLEVLKDLVTVPYRYLFQPRTFEIESFKERLPMVRILRNWNELADELLPPR